MLIWTYRLDDLIYKAAKLYKLYNIPNWFRNHPAEFEIVITNITGIYANY